MLLRKIRKYFAYKSQMRRVKKRLLGILRVVGDVRQDYPDFEDLTGTPEEIKMLEVTLELAVLEQELRDIEREYRGQE